MQQSSRRWAAMTGAAAVLAAGLGLTGYVVARAASSSPSHPAAADASTSNSGSSHGSGAPGGRAFRGALGFPGPRSFGRNGAVAGGGAMGTVEHLDATSFTLQSARGTTLTVVTTGSTTYYEALSKVSASTLRDGDHVVVLFKRPAAGSPSTATSKLTATRVDIVLPSLGGEVLSDAGGTIVIADSQGFHRTIVTSTSTRYFEAGTSVAANAVRPGTDVVAVGSIASDHTDLDAAAVEVVGPSVAGKVTKISGSTITITPLRGGSTETVTTESSTIFRSGGASSSLAKLKRGDYVLVIGTRTSATSFAASAVRFGIAPKLPAGTGRGWGGKGFGVGGPFGGPAGSPTAFGGGSSLSESGLPGTGMGLGLSGFGPAAAG